MCAATDGTPYGRVMEVMGQLASAGIHGVALITESSNQRQDSPAQPGAPSRPPGRQAHALGLALSIFFHGLLLAVVMIGWPNFSKPVAEKSVDVPVEIVTGDQIQPPRMKRTSPTTASPTTTLPSGG